MKRITVLLMGLFAMWLAGCAATLRSDVTSFQQWPANTTGATYGFKRLGKQAESLEHKSYEDLARIELNKLKLVEAPAGAKPRFEVSLDYGIATRTERTREPVWDDRIYWHPPYYHGTLGWRPGYWAHDPFGPQIVGYRTVYRDVSDRRLRVDISEGGAKVFEASATSSGSGKSLPIVMPYLVRSVFLGFPGTNGQVRVIDYDVDKGTLKALSVKTPQ
jgi:Domain of unknown function (DUF4136)